MDIKEFCYEINRSPIGKKTIRKAITPKFLEEINFKKKEYEMADIVKIYNLFIKKKKEIESEKNKKEIKNLVEEETKDVSSYLISGFNDSQNIDIRKFIFLTLSDKFIEDIKTIRKEYLIDENGFKNKYDKQNWRKSISSEKFEELNKEIFLLQCKYNLKIDNNNLYLYVLGGFDNKNLSTILKKWDLPSIFFNHGFLIYDDDLYSPAIFSIGIRQPVSKKEFLSFIEENWIDIENAFTEEYDKLSMSKNLCRDWLIFYYYKKGNTTKNIFNIIDIKYHEYEISIDIIKQTISRIKKRLKEFEKYEEIN